MGHKYTKTELLEGALAVAREQGLSQLSFGRVAKHLGTSDRVIVYYFPRKEDLYVEVIQALGQELQTRLAAAVPAAPGDHRELCRAAWPVLAHPDADRAFGLFFEANGLAASGVSPFDQLVPTLVTAWIDWVAALLPGTTAHRRREAELTVALLDGLLLFRQTAGAAAANRVARSLGIL